MAESIGCAYLVDRNPRFLEMARVSLEGLRQHDPGLPVVVLVVDDERVVDSVIEPIAALADEIRFVAPRHAHTGYFPDNKVHLRTLDFDVLVYLDADTFVFGSIEKLARIFSQFDVAARPNDWVHRFGYRSAMAPDLYCLMNSGVVVARREFVRAWAGWSTHRPRELVADPARADLVAWMYAMSPKAYHREEVAFSELVWSGEWSVGIMSDADCYLLERFPEHEAVEAWTRTTVLHSFSSEWDACACRLAEVGYLCGDFRRQHAQAQRL